MNPRSRDIDTLTADEIVEVMILDNRNVLAAVQREKARIARGAELVADAVLGGGRLIFVGAGTSGRLGVLEAAELPPTFGIDPTTAQAIMAGGAGAVHRAKEGVEDDYDGGRAGACAASAPTRKDVVIGISASGITPFVRGAVTRARAAKARDHRRDMRSALGAEGSGRRRHRAERRARGDCRLDAAESRHRDEGRAQHADDGGDGARGEDVRQSDGRREVELRQASRSRAPHHRHRDGLDYEAADALLSGRSGT